MPSRELFVVEGGEELAERLRGLGKGIDVDLAESAMLEAADPMRQRAEELAPRDKGKLAGNIRLMAGKQEPGAATVNVGTTSAAWYGRYPEFGTRFQAAQPFLRPAYDTEKDATVRRWGEILLRTIMRFVEEF